MGVEEGMSNGDVAECSDALHCSKSEAMTNGFELHILPYSGDGSSGPSEGFRTYKRRRHARLGFEGKMLEYGRVSVEASNLCADQMVERACEIPVDSREQHCLLGKESHSPLNGTNDCSQRNWRNILLEHMCESLSDDEGGIQGCIRDALLFHPEIDHTVMVKESHPHDVGETRCSSQTWKMLNGTQHRDKRQNGVISNGPADEAKCHAVSEMCQRVFFNILISEKFTSLCKLLLENFGGSNAGSLFHLSLINSRLKEGVYEHSPMLFSADIQQVWRKLQGIGDEIISLSKSLSDMSETLFREQVGCIVPCTVDPEKDELCTRESDSLAKLEHPATYGIYRICTCKQCGQKADGRNCLVCDSCEEMYHVSCIEPAVVEIPPKSWYCAKCTASGIGSPHENCVVCEQLNAPRNLRNNGGDEITPATEDMFNELEDNSNSSLDDGHQASEGSRSSSTCKICGGEVETDEKVRTCEHAFCSSKYYHARCLTTKQLKSYGPCWYCPSCLCRVCLTDKDDDKIVLCDGCDDAYHIYCMKPPRTSVPRGKWFCRKCNIGIQRIRSAKREYEKYENKQLQKGRVSKTEKKLSEKGKEESDKGRGGMDMLLNAAKTLNYEEQMAAVQTKS